VGFKNRRFPHLLISPTKSASYIQLPNLVRTLTMGCGMSTPSGRRAYKHVYLKTKEYDVFIETVPRRVEPGDRQHAQFPLGPQDPDFRWPTNRRGEPVDIFAARDPKKPMYAGSGKAKKAFVVRRITEHDKNHEMGVQVERDEEGNPMEGAVGMPVGSEYKGQTEGWEPYKKAFGAEFRGGRFFQPQAEIEERNVI
jgi:hypothetical protein